jgi:lysophospholipase
VSVRTLDAPDGTALHLLELGDADAAKTLLVVHGYGEHGGRYEERAQLFVDVGYRVLISDVRGHGRSGGNRGHVMSFATYLDDLARVIEEVGENSKLFLFGHSHGGLIAATWLAERPSRVVRAALTSPFFGLGLKPPAWKELAARVLGRYLPKVSLPSEINPAHVSHDPAVVENYKTDPLNHSVANSRWYLEAMAAQERAFAAAPRVSLPTLVLQAGDDKLVSPAATRRWCDAAPESVEYEEIAGAYHELFFELDGQNHAQRVLDWFESHT